MLRIVDFFLHNVAGSPAGLCRGLYNTDQRRHGDWWTGLLLPLAYTEPGADLDRLMGPVHQLLADVIRNLGTSRGLYVRCAVEEYEPLLRAYELERERGVKPADWLVPARSLVVSS